MLRLVVTQSYMSNLRDCEETAGYLFDLMQLTKLGVTVNFIEPWQKAELDFDPDQSKESISKIISQELDL